MVSCCLDGLDALADVAGTGVGTGSEVGFAVGAADLVVFLRGVLTGVSLETVSDAFFGFVEAMVCV